MRTLTSVDTNILLYSLNADAPENERARQFLRSHAQDQDFLVSELVLVELYMLLRNPVVLPNPMGSAEAVAVIQHFRRHPSWQIVDHEPAVMDEVWALAAQDSWARSRIIDARLAKGLARRGVTRFATHNLRHMAGLGIADVFDPLL